MRVLRIEPTGSAIVGQRIYGESGPKFLHLGVTMELTEIDRARGLLGIKVELPLGVMVRENLLCGAVGEIQCRVTYN